MTKTINMYINEKALELTEFMNQLKINDEKLGIDLSKGKKVRGCLTLLIADSLNGNILKAKEFASAIELIHLGSITHDDVLDEHTERRKSIPLHLLKGSKFAVLTGDRLFTLATKLGSKNGGKEGLEVSEAMESVLNGAIQEIGFKDLIVDIASGDMLDKFYYKMIGLKTASLFKSAGKFGAMSFTDKASIINNYGDIGYNVGLAYQIADDLTDIIKIAEGEKDPDFGTIISLVPAVIHYNTGYAKQFPFIALSGRISIEKILETIASFDMSGKMIIDIKKILKETEDLIDTLEIQNEYTALLNKYPKYCINQILNEVGESV